MFGGDHQNMLNLRADRGNSPYDVRHTFMYSFNYELPFGRDKGGLSAALLRAGR